MADAVGIISGFLAVVHLEEDVGHVDREVCGVASEVEEQGDSGHVDTSHLHVLLVDGESLTCLQTYIVREVVEFVVAGLEELNGCLNVLVGSDVALEVVLVGSSGSDVSVDRELSLPLFCCCCREDILSRVVADLESIVVCLCPTRSVVNRRGLLCSEPEVRVGSTLGSNLNGLLSRLDAALVGSHYGEGVGSTSLQSFDGLLDSSA